jgi:hypothetical protein
MLGFQQYSNQRRRPVEGCVQNSFWVIQTGCYAFGMNNTPSTFCRAMSRLLKPLLDRYPNKLFVYMDNILIATGDNIERHCQITHEVLDLLEEESYFLRPAKCTFEQSSLTYLGIIVDGNQLRPDPKKTSALRDWPQTLHTVKEVRSILGV